MNQSEYQLMAESQNNHWWYLGRRQIIQNLISKYKVTDSYLADVCDLAAGTGSNLPLLTKIGKVTALEMDADSVRFLEDTWGDKVKVIQWKFPDSLDQKFDLILCADVLEHIDNDQEAVAWIHSHLKDNGYLVVTVPAHNYLWTQMDDVVGHKRRYSKPQLLSLFDGFTIMGMSYYNFFLFPVKLVFTWVVNLLKRFRLNNPDRSYNEVAVNPKMSMANELMKRISFFEAKIIPTISLPYGVSLIVILSKNT